MDMDEIMRAAQGSKPLGQLPRHIHRRRRCTRGDCRKPIRDAQQVLDAMAHLTCEQFVTFFCLLAACHIKKDSEHCVIDFANVATLATGRYPANQVSDQNTKINLVAAAVSAGGRKCGSHPVTVGRVYFGRKVLKRDALARRNAPNMERALIHVEQVGLDIP